MSVSIWLDFQNNRIKPKTVENYACAVFGHFFKRQLKRDVDVTIKFVKQFPCGSSGFCSGDPNNVLIEIARGATWPEGYREYEFWHQMETLAHEIVHAKQFIRGEFKTEKHHPTKSPSEKEAYGLQRELYETYWRA